MLGILVLCLDILHKDASVLPTGLSQGVTGLPLKGWPLTVSYISLSLPGSFFYLVYA